jgi:AraC-like DNA-binding protein
MGKSFGWLREQIQIRHAQRQLDSGISVNEVAFELGYESPSAFIAMFKRNTGQTPGIFSVRTKLTSKPRSSCSD